MITRRDLARALSRGGVTDWTIVERVADVGRADRPGRVRRSERRTSSTVIAHQDLPTGRGSIRLDIAAHDDANQLVAQAIQLATSAVGPAWKSLPPAAPAKVDVLDRTVADADLVELAARTLRALQPASDLAIEGTLEIVRERVAVQSRAGQNATWDASHLRAELLVSDETRSLTIVREGRRLSDLLLDGAVASAARDLELLARARAATPGRCSVVLGTDVLLHGERGGVWAIFVAQADALLERQGLTRYRLGTPIVDGAPTAPEPLTIVSDGALPYGLLSAPVSDEGDAIRRFALVERGVAVGLGLSAREAVLRNMEANGGVRNLVVTAGTWDGDRPTKRTVEIRRLRALAIDAYTGDASLEIALGIDHDKGAERPFTGGTVRLDLVATLAFARRSAAITRRGSYEGPESVLVDAADLSA